MASRYKTTLLAAVGVLSAALAPVAAAGGRQTTPDPIGLTDGSRHVTRHQLQARRPLHERYLPRGASFPDVPRIRAVPPTPRFGSREVGHDNARRLLRRWAARPSAVELQRRVDRALVMPELGGLSTEKALHGWEAIGVGIHHDVTHDKAGRVTGAQYVFDDALGYTTLYLGTVGGGLWKFVNLGVLGVWTPVSDNLPGSPSVGAFLVDPYDSNRILIGTGDHARFPGSGLFRSGDGGASWTAAALASPPDAFHRIVQDTTDPEVVLAAGSSGIWRSVDFGASWTRIANYDTTDLLIDPLTPRYWYAGARGVGVLESSDGGLTFAPIGGDGGLGPGDAIERVALTQCAAAPNYLFALVEGRDAADDVGALHGIYRSADYGASWESIDATDSISFGQGFHASAIAVDPDDPDRLFVGMALGQWTENATAATPCWRRAIADDCTACGATGCLDAGHADMTSFLFVPDALAPGNTSVVITNDGGYYLYDYAFGTISGRGNTLGLNAMQVLGPGQTLSSSYSEPNRLLTGLQDNGMVRIDTASSQRLLFRGKGDGAQTSIAPGDAETVAFSSGVPYKRYISTDFAVTWQLVECAFADTSRPSMLIDPTPLLGSPVVTTHANDNDDPALGFLFQKPIGAACDWLKVNPGSPVPGEIRRIDQANNNLDWVYYATLRQRDDTPPGTDLYVMDSSEHGFPGSMTWEVRTPPLPTSGFDPSEAHASADRSVLRPKTVYYATGYARPSRAFVSHDAGKSWRDVTGNLADTLADTGPHAQPATADFHELIGNPANPGQLFLATSVGVFATEEGHKDGVGSAGPTWYRYMTGLPAVVEAMAIDLNHDNAAAPILRIGTFGRGYWERVLNLGTGLWIGSDPDPARWANKIWIDNQETLDPAAEIGQPEASFVGFSIGDRFSQQDHTLFVDKLGDELFLFFQ